eukprot:scaffold61804_cov65-Phaeocystis_antarctica.AAC.3
MSGARRKGGFSGQLCLTRVLCNTPVPISASWRTRRDQVAAPQPLAAQPQAGRRPRRKACSATAVVVTPRAQPQQS